jgi:hypothetical protein
MPAYVPLIQSLEESFQKILKDIPGMELGHLDSSANHPLLSYDIEIDVTNELHGFEVPIKTGSGENWKAIVQVRSSGEPRLIRESCVRLRDLIAGHPDKNRLYPVIAATFIGKKAAEICQKYDVGYLDLSGNCRLAFGSVYISREVATNKNPEKRPLKSLFSPKSSRIVRVLLEQPKKLWQVQELAESTSVSLGLVSKVKQKLLDQDLAASAGGLLKLKDPVEVLQEWSRNYSYKDNASLSLYATGGQYEIEGYLQKYCEQKHKNYALTLFSGSNRVAPFVRGISLSSAYVNGDLQEIAAALKWRPVTSGANFILMQPEDEFFMRGIQSAPSIWPGQIVSDIQLYLDLNSYKLRGEEAAEHLFETRIRPHFEGTK